MSGTVDAVLVDALAPVLRDVDAAGVPRPMLRAGHWTDDDRRPSAVLADAAGESGSGVAVDREAAEHERVARAADTVHDWVLEELWSAGGPTNWPPCPAHPDNHPLQVRVEGGRAAWCCPVGGPVADVGSLT